MTSSSEGASSRVPQGYCMYTFYRMRRLNVISCTLTTQYCSGLPLKPSRLRYRTKAQWRTLQNWKLTWKLEEGTTIRRPCRGTPLPIEKDDGNRITLAIKKCANWIKEKIKFPLESFPCEKFFWWRKIRWCIAPRDDNLHIHRISELESLKKNSWTESEANVI